MRGTWMIIALVALCCGPHSSWAAGAPAELPEVSGVVGMTPVTASSYAAVWVPVPKGQALAEIVWYNNDRQAVFPQLLVASGVADQPVSVADCVSVGEAVSGVSSDWSSFTLAEPIKSSRGGFYVLFQLPAGSVQVGVGEGGGAGLGYVENGGCEGWMSIDGQEWVKVGRSCGFAVVPRFVAANDGMLDKSMTGEGRDGDAVPEEQVFETALLPASPNPFNPVTEIRFTMKQAGWVNISVYDLRGREVVRLASEMYPTGAHSVRWEGRDAMGQRVSSGAYFVQMNAASEQFARRVMLVK